VDGFRVDTVKHVEESVWKVFNKQSKLAFEEWKSNHPEKMLHDDEFFIMGELYGYHAAGGRNYEFSDGAVDYFDAGYDAMINFGFKEDAQGDYATLFKKYDLIRDSLSSENKGSPAYYMNYISSHDDGQPFDPLRKKAMKAGTKLLLTPGMSQVYYGDETARLLIADGAVGDANLRTMMNWESIDQNVLAHWQKLGRFRRDHAAVGAGTVEEMTYNGPGSLTARFYAQDSNRNDVIVGAGLPDGNFTLDVSKVFKDQTLLHNSYTNETVAIENGIVKVNVVNGVLLLEKTAS
jgi:alpha-amylase